MKMLLTNALLLFALHTFAQDNEALIKACGTGDIAESLGPWLKKLASPRQRSERSLEDRRLEDPDEWREARGKFPDDHSGGHL